MMRSGRGAAIDIKYGFTKVKDEHENALGGQAGVLVLIDHFHAMHGAGPCFLCDGVRNAILVGDDSRWSFREELVGSIVLLR